jgi:hypothetical protein
MLQHPKPRNVTGCENVTSTKTTEEKRTEQTLHEVKPRKGTVRTDAGATAAVKQRNRRELSAERGTELRMKHRVKKNNYN